MNDQIKGLGSSEVAYLLTVHKALILTAPNGQLDSLIWCGDYSLMEDQEQE